MQIIEEKLESISSDMQYHIANDIPINENVFKYGSESWLNIINEARQLFNDDFVIELTNEEYNLIMSDAGKKGVFENNEVLLDVPFICEDGQHMNVYVNDDGVIKLVEFGRDEEY